MKMLIDFMYTGNIYFTSKNVLSILNTATKLEMQTAVDLCKQFMTMLSDMPQPNHKVRYRFFGKMF